MQCREGKPTENIYKIDFKKTDVVSVIIASAIGAVLGVAIATGLAGILGIATLSGLAKAVIGIICGAIPSIVKFHSFPDNGTMYLQSIRIYYEEEAKLYLQKSTMHPNK